MILSKNHFIALGIFLILFDFGIDSASRTIKQTYVFENVYIIHMKNDLPVLGHIPLSISIERVAVSSQSMIAHAEEIQKFTKNFNLDKIKSFVNILVENETWITATLTTTQNILDLFENPLKKLCKPIPKTHFLVIVTIRLR